MNTSTSSLDTGVWWPAKVKPRLDAVGVLKQLEWSATYSYCTGWPSCPICGGIKPGHGRDEYGTLPDNQGHRQNCDLAKALLGG